MATAWLASSKDSDGQGLHRAETMGNENLISYRVRGPVLKEQFRRFLLNALRAGNPGSVDLWPMVEGRVWLHARQVKVVQESIRGAALGVKLVEARGVEGVDYVSKSGNTRLRWRKVVGDLGVLEGVASPWTLRLLNSSGVDLASLRVELVKSWNLSGAEAP